MVDLQALLADLEAECTDLDALVAGLPSAEWARPTPAAGWTIAHQIGHLTWTDEVAALSATDAEAFGELVREALPRALTFVDEAAEQAAATPAPELLARWRRGRATLAPALRAVPPGTKLPWFGPPMSPASMVSARLMETWAHGQDVADALGANRTPTVRLRNIAHLGVRTRNFAYQVHGRTPPAEEFRVELRGPGGELWTWGPEEAAQRVEGPALDFCLLVTQRRHPGDLAVTAHGPDAVEWLGIAQAFAGPAGTGRTAGQFAH
ncbi:TIGR03084 family metal-binding protein [Nocardia sp. CDC159]|uniref:TIGR03084 family metal-binding protein n=1 Tax=Nocardia pulmonis TaxID=2951408 RepID=A0A9X2E9Y9_9NOCA|nr:MULTISPECIES: TIGR03084 family metal-binding protein [Nocardia]MCM6777027.1 TIGR03084 family metal-binding protein [Nocardia pulmonis]MCM6789451.1 TIGR03084 family metal-binding protein [Nocardia sp. CDC159]